MIYNNADEKLIEDYILNSSEDIVSAVMVFNIDNFLSICSDIGREEADLVIAKFNDTVSSFFRGTDIVVRLGGDEFVALVKNLGSINNAEKICNKILQKISSINAGNRTLTASIGVSLFPFHGKGYEELKNKAYQSLVRMKSSGKNGYRIYESAMTKTASSINNLGSLSGEEWLEYMDNICFKIFSKDSSPETSVNTILEIMCLYFGFTRAFIIYHNTDSDDVLKYEFDIPGNEINQGPLLDALREDFICRLYDNFGDYGICNDGVFIGDPEVTSFMQDMNDKQVLFFALKNNDIFNGAVVFENDDINVSLEKYINNLYDRFNVILSYINILRNFNNSIDVMNKLSVFSNMDALVYVVDTTTREVLYMNKKAISCEFGFVIGTKCHELMYKNPQICDGCPLLKLDKANPGDKARIESFNYSSKNWAINLFSWLSPDDNPGKALIVSIDLDAFFDEIGK